MYKQQKEKFLQHLFKVLELWYCNGITFLSIICIHLLSSSILLHLFFLKRSRYINRNKNQIVIMTSLCICKLIGPILIISYCIFQCLVSLLVANIILCFTLIFWVQLLIHQRVSIDTFLVIYLKFKFLFYNSPSKILTLIVAFASVCLCYIDSTANNFIGIIR